MRDPGRHRPIPRAVSSAISVNGAIRQRAVDRARRRDHLVERLQDDTSQMTG